MLIRVEGHCIVHRVHSPSVSFSVLNILTFHWFDWTFQRRPDTVYIVGPWSTFAISAVGCPTISSISIKVLCSCTPTTMLNSEEYHVSLTSNSVAFVNCVFSLSVVASEKWVRTIHLGYSSVSFVFPTAKCGVC